MKNTPLLLSLILIELLGSCTSEIKTSAIVEPDINYWVTTADRSQLLSKDPTGLKFSDQSNDLFVIEVDTTQQFQTIDGFGYSLTGGSAWLINQKLDQGQRDALLGELFLTDGNKIGVSYLRVSIGSSDLDDQVFSYCDLLPGKTDPELENFTLAEDKKNLIPVLKEILALNPDIQIMGSPWSPPVWMKSNKLPKGGKLLPEYYPVYAIYFVKYIQGMAAEGITIHAVTPQNEPEHPGNTPSLAMTAPEQAEFVKNHLGPAFERAGLKTKIVIYDHNCDHPQYPISILNDPQAKKYIDGSAFHMYLGEIAALSEVHDAHPDKNVYFTEQWTSGKGDFGGDLRWHVRELIVGASRNWSKTVLEWNLASDPQFNPHTDDGGCTECQGALTIGDSVTRNVSYFIIAHASKFARPGATRVASSVPAGLPNVAFRNIDGKKVLIVLNDTDEPKNFALKFKEKLASASLLPGAVGTFVW